MAEDVLPPEASGNPLPTPADEAVRPSPVKVVAESLNLKNLARKIDFAAARPKTVLTMIVISKPQKVFIQTLPQEQWMTFDTIWRKKSISGLDEQVAIIAEEILPFVPPDFLNMTTFVPYQTLQGEVGLWPIKFETDGRKPNDWATTALEVATEAQTKWVRLANAGTHYDFEKSEATKVPDFKGLTQEKFFELGLKKYVISASDDALLKELRGEE